MIEKGKAHRKRGVSPGSEQLCAHSQKACDKSGRNINIYVNIVIYI